MFKWQKKRKFAGKHFFYTKHGNYNRQLQTKSVNKPVGRAAARSLSRELELLVSCRLCWFNIQFFLFPLHRFFCFRHYIDPGARGGDAARFFCNTPIFSAKTHLFDPTLWTATSSVVFWQDVCRQICGTPDIRPVEAKMGQSTRSEVNYVRTLIKRLSRWKTA